MRWPLWRPRRRCQRSKAHGPVGQRVVAGRTGGDEGGLGLVVQERLCAQDRAASAVERGGVGRGGQKRVPVDVTAFGAGGHAQRVDVIAIVERFQARNGRGDRRAGLEAKAAGFGFEKALQEGGDAACVLGVACGGVVAHLGGAVKRRWDIGRRLPVGKGVVCKNVARKGAFEREGAFWAITLAMVRAGAGEKPPKKRKYLRKCWFFMTFS